MCSFNATLFSDTKLKYKYELCQVADLMKHVLNKYFFF